jgi:hypothetical protein
MSSLEETIVSQMSKRTFTMGKSSYLLPFRANGLWVDDSRQTSVCQAQSPDEAKVLARILNAHVHNN